MKHELCIAALLALIPLNCAVAENETPAGPKVKLSTSSVQFGEISPCKAHERTLTVTNTGDAELIVNAVKSTCPCTKVEIDEEHVPPGESATLRISLHLADYHSDKVQGRVFLCANTPDPCCTPIEVKGDIIPEYVLEPPRVDFGRVKRGKIVTATCILRRNGSRPVELRTIKATNDIQVSWRSLIPEDTHTENAEAQETPPDAYRVDIQFTAPLDANILNAQFEVETNIKRRPKQVIPVKARLVGVECTMTPKVIVFDDAKSGDTVKGIEIAGEYDLEIVKAECTIKGVEPALSELETRKRYRIDLRLTDRVSSGDVIGKLLLSVKEGPLEENREVGIFGNIDS